jgi:hypothetical protein
MAYYTSILHTLTVLVCCVSPTFEEDAFLPDQGKFDFSFVADSQNNVSICFVYKYNSTTLPCLWH